MAPSNFYNYTTKRTMVMRFFVLFLVLATHMGLLEAFHVEKADGTATIADESAAEQMFYIFSSHDFILLNNSRNTEYLLSQSMLTLSEVIQNTIASSISIMDVENVIVSSVNYTAADAEAAEDRGKHNNNLRGHERHAAESLFDVTATVLSSETIGEDIMTIQYTLAIDLSTSTEFANNFDGAYSLITSTISRSVQDGSFTSTLHSFAKTYNCSVLVHATASSISYDPLSSLEESVQSGSSSEEAASLKVGYIAIMIGFGFLLSIIMIMSCILSYVKSSRHEKYEDDWDGEGSETCNDREKGGDLAKVYKATIDTRESRFELLSYGNGSSKDDGLPIGGGSGTGTGTGDCVSAREVFISLGSLFGDGQDSSTKSNCVEEKQSRKAARRAYSTKAVSSKARAGKKLVRHPLRNGTNTGHQQLQLTHAARIVVAVGVYGTEINSRENRKKRMAKANKSMTPQAAAAFAAPQEGESQRGIERGVTTVGTSSIDSIGLFGEEIVRSKSDDRDAHSNNSLSLDKNSVDEDDESQDLSLSYDGSDVESSGNIKRAAKSAASASEQGVAQRSIPVAMLLSSEPPPRLVAAIPPSGPNPLARRNVQGRWHNRSGLFIAPSDINSASQSFTAAAAASDNDATTGGSDS